MKKGQPVWLPVKISLAYLLEATKAEAMTAKAEVEDLKAAAKAAAEARTASAGPKHQPIVG